MRTAAARSKPQGSPLSLTELAACTYEVRGKIEAMGETRYLLRRSDGRSLNLSRCQALRIQHQGKITGGAL